VVVKVQRPNIRQRILEDLDAFQQMAKVLEKHTAVGERMDLSAVLDEFRQTILEELDYQLEARNLDRMADQLREFESIVVPRPVPDYTTGRVLTMDYIEGEKITKVSPVVLLEADGEALAEDLFQAYLQQILIDGFFHADPHPGNVFLTPDNRIALLDLGMVDRLPPRLQESLLMMVLAIADGRGEEAAEHALAIAERRDQVDEAAFRRRVADLVVRYSGIGLVDLPVGQAFLDIAQAAVESGARLPAETTLLGKALFNLDAIGRVLSPSFDPTASIRQNAIRLLRKRMFKTLSPGNVVSGALELREFAGRLPSRINRILDAAASNQLGVRIDTGIDADQLMVGFQKIANRITTGLVIAALIIGAAMLMRIETSFRIFGYPGFAILLFLAAAGGGIALLIAILTKDYPERRG
jgi:predicted unusual protein kinase regulating ubiquinone biosynthesis (AarF/ABC1/UbiB family)